MSNKAAVGILMLFLGVGTVISYDQISKQDSTDAVILQEGKDYAVNNETEVVIEVQMYYYAAETFDKILVPLAFASEVITDDDIEQFVLLTETIFPQVEYAEIDKGVEMIMLHVNKNRQYPVWVEVIRVSE